MSEDGVISITTSNSPTPQNIGQIILARFINTAGLNSIGRNLYLETAASGTPITGTPASSGFGVVEQGYLEQSNVQIVEEMVNMIIAQRAYEANSKSIQTVDIMLGDANNLKRT